MYRARWSWNFDITMATTCAFTMGSRINNPDQRPARSGEGTITKLAFPGAPTSRVGAGTGLVGVLGMKEGAGSPELPR